jgi:hypothetical protein
VRRLHEQRAVPPRVRARDRGDAHVLRPVRC